MQRHPHVNGIVLASAFAAMIVASCAAPPLEVLRVAALIQVSGNGQQGPIGSSLGQPLVVRVEDEAGQPVVGTLVSWSVSSGGGSVSPSQSFTGTDGVAQASLRLGVNLGLNSVRATLGTVEPVTFNATATAGPAANLIAQSGNGQTAIVGELLPNDLVVKVTDAVGNPKTGVVVTFAVASGGGTLNVGSITTDANGQGGVRWRLGPATGTQTLIATATGLPARLFTATALPF